LEFVSEEGSDSRKSLPFFIDSGRDGCGCRESGIRKVNFIAADIEESFKEHTCILKTFMPGIWQEAGSS